MEPVVAVGLTAAISAIVCALIPVLGNLFGGSKRTVQVTLDEKNWQDLVNWMQQNIISLQEAMGTLSKLMEHEGRVDAIQMERWMRMWREAEAIQRKLDDLLHDTSIRRIR